MRQSKPRKEQDMKKRIIGLSVVIILLALVCGAVWLAFFRYDKPEKDLGIALEGMMKQNAQAAERYMDYQSFHDLGGDDVLRKTLLLDFAYEVTEVQKPDKKHASAVIHVSNRDMGTLYGNFVIDAYQFVISEAYKPDQEKLSEDELKQTINAMLMEHLENKEVHLRERDINVEMTREDRTWFIHFDDQDYDDIYGGYVTAREQAQTVLGDMSSKALVNVEEAYMKNIDDADHVLRNAAHFIVDDLWNGTLCNIVSSINAGTDHMGNDYDLENGLKTLDGLMTEKVTYDVYIGNLSEIEYGKIKTGWKDLSDTLRQLVDEIKAENPTPKDYDYLPDTTKFEEKMNQFIKLIYQDGK